MVACGPFRIVGRRIDSGIDRVPIGGGFLPIASVILATAGLAAAQVRSLEVHPRASAGQLAMVGVTATALAAAIVAYRGAKAGSRLIVAIAAAVVFVGGLWPWLTFVMVERLPALHQVAMLVAAPFALLLLLRSVRVTDRFGIFAGLGFTAFLLAAAVAHSAPTAAMGSPVLALLASLGAVVVLYAALLEVRRAEQASLEELLESRRRIENEVERAEGILHDLRSGLLAIEAVVGSLEGELAAPLRAEAARLRRLTIPDEGRIATFDLVERIGDLVATRRAAGLAVELRCPQTARVVADETDVLAIVENLLANAERHGLGRSVLVEITVRLDGTLVTVSNQGPAIEPDATEAIFTRGTTTHPSGSGLGLSRSRTLAARNDAELTLLPTRGGRTTFALRLRSGHESPASAGVLGRGGAAAARTEDAA